MKKYLESPIFYMGNKYKLLKQLIPLFPDKCKTFLDLFGGSCLMIRDIFDNFDRYGSFYNMLFEDVEIIEEPKKIEKIARCDYIKMTHYGDLYKPTENEEILRIKVNELIDAVNELKRDK